MSHSMLLYLNGVAMLAMGFPLLAISMYGAASLVWVSDRISEAKRKPQAKL